MNNAYDTDELTEWALAQEVPPLIYSSADPKTVAGAQARFGTTQIAQRVETLFADLATKLAPLTRGLRPNRLNEDQMGTVARAFKADWQGRRLRRQCLENAGSDACLRHNRVGSLRLTCCSPLKRYPAVNEVNGDFSCCLLAGRTAVSLIGHLGQVHFIVLFPFFGIGSHIRAKLFFAVISGPVRLDRCMHVSDR